MTMKKNEMRLHLKSSIMEVQLALMADDPAALQAHLAAASAGLHRVQSALNRPPEEPVTGSALQKPTK